MTRVMASGAFDIIHSGHLHYLHEARKLGDELVVVVATDATMRRRKHEPIIPERMRLELVSALKPVDAAVLGGEGDMYAVVENVRPDIIAIGYDQDFDEGGVEEALRKRGIRVKVVRVSALAEDLMATRRIIKRVIEWYSMNKDSVDRGGSP
jgi:FAD synthetase